MIGLVALDDAQAQFIDALVQSGHYADRREVVQAALDAFRDCDAAFERWINENFVSLATAMMADPSRTIPVGEVFDDIDRRHAARVAAGV